jgi:hypothetical protein
MSLEATSLEDWQAAVSRRNPLRSPKVPDEIAHAMFEAVRLQYLVTHRFELNHMGFRLDGKPSEPSKRYELISESDAQAYNAKALELAKQVRDYFIKTNGVTDKEPHFDDCTSNFFFDLFSNLTPGNFALVGHGDGYSARIIPNGAVAFEVKSDIARSLHSTSYRDAVRMAREQLDAIADDMIPGRKEAREESLAYMRR